MAAKKTTRKKQSPPQFVTEVETFTSSSGGIQPYYFRLRAANGEIVAQSEGYTTYQARDESARKLAAQLGHGGFFVEGLTSW